MVQPLLIQVGSQRVDACYELLCIIGLTYPSIVDLMLSCSDCVLNIIFKQNYDFV
jgi:hypothetical protein